jgi:hypothetical protein
MAVRIAPQHTAASTRLPLTRRIRFPRHGCYGLWAARIPSRHATCRYSCSRPSEPVSSSHPDGRSRRRVVRGWRSPVSLVSRHPQSPMHSALRLEASRARRKHCAGPRLSTRPTPPGCWGIGACDGRVCVLLDLLLLVVSAARASLIVPVVHALRLCRRAACDAFQGPEAPRCRSGTRPGVAVAEAWRCVTVRTLFGDS